MSQKSTDWSLEAPELGISLNDPISVLVGKKPYKTTQDKHGHDVFLGAKFPKTFLRTVAKIRNVPGSPYEINADVVRDAIHLGLIIILMRCQDNSDWNQIAALASISSRMAELAEMASRISEVVESVESLCSAGWTQRAKADISDLVKALEAFDDEQQRMYKGLLFKALQTKRLQNLLDEI